MRKQWLCLILSALLALGAVTGAAGEESAITIQDIMAANTVEAVLARHRNAAESLKSEDGSRVVYLDKDIRYEHYLPGSAADAGSAYEIMLDADGAVMYNEQYDMFYYVANVGLGHERKYTLTDENFGNLAYDPEATALETVKSVQDQGGNWLVITETETEKLMDLDRDLPADGVYVVEYTLEKGTLEILGTVEYVVRANGEREQESRQQLMYDIDPTEDVTTMARAMKAIMTEEPRRTLTFVKDPGTPEEKKTEITLMTGVFVTYWADEKGYSDYADPEGTTPWTDDFMTDQVIYLINPMKNSVAL